MFIDINNYFKQRKNQYIEKKIIILMNQKFDFNLYLFNIFFF